MSPEERRPEDRTEDDEPLAEGEQVAWPLPDDDIGATILLDQDLHPLEAAGGSPAGAKDASGDELEEDTRNVSAAPPDSAAPGAAGTMVLRRGQEAFLPSDHVSNLAPPSGDEILGSIASRGLGGDADEWEDTLDATEMVEDSTTAPSFEASAASEAPSADPKDEKGAVFGETEVAETERVPSAREETPSEDVYVILPESDDAGTEDIGAEVTEALDDDALAQFGEAASGDWEGGATEVVDEGWFDADSDALEASPTELFDGSATELVDEDALDELTSELDEDVLEGGSPDGSSFGDEPGLDPFGDSSALSSLPAPRSKIGTIVRWVGSVAALAVVGFICWSVFGPEPRGNAIAGRGESPPRTSEMESPVATVSPSDTEVLVEALDETEQNEELREAEATARELVRSQISFVLKHGFSGVGNE